MDSLRLRFWLSALALAGMELAAVVVPAISLVRWPAARADLLAWVFAPACLLAAGAWHAAAARWLAPIYRARAEDGGAPVRAAARQAMLVLPGRALALRAGLWLALGAALAALAAAAGFARADAAALCGILGGNGAVVSLFRAAWYEWLLERPLREIEPDLDPASLFAARARARVGRMALLATGLAITVFALFTYFFIPLTLEQYRYLQTSLPLAALAGHLLWHPYLRARLRPLRAWPAARGSAGEAAAARAAWTAGQTLAYRLAAVRLPCLLGPVAAALALGVLRDEIDRERALLGIATWLIAAVGAALVEILLHRHALRPALESLGRGHPALLREARTPWTLRRKMIAGFGALALFLCGLSLFWAFVHYRNLAQKFIQAQAERELDHVIDRMAEAGGATPERLRRALREGVLGTELVMLWLPRRGPVIGAADGHTAPPLSSATLASVRRRGRGWLDAAPIRMQGAFRPIDEARPDLGQLVVLLPGYLGRGPRIEPAIRTLIAFFLVLFAVATGIVAMAARDLAAPVRALEARARSMARGDLDEAVPAAPEADEVGELAATLEDMRRSVNEKIAALRELQAHLERRVQERTRDLERSNEELRQALDALRVAQGKLVAQGKMAIVGQLVAGVAHEINNPINAIVNTVEPLEQTVAALVAGGGSAAERELHAQVREMVAVVRRGADRTKKIVQALRNYARGDDEELADIDLHRGLDEALELLRHELRDGVTVERAFGEVGRVRGHPGQLNQVFLNLLSNAVQAVAGRPDGRVRVETRRAGAAVEVTVADNGPGIPDDVLPRIFDPFFTTKPVGQGTGLGLSICQQIAERHGGSIRVESAPGQGARFTVALPQD